MMNVCEGMARASGGRGAVNLVASRNKSLESNRRGKSNRWREREFAGNRDRGTCLPDKTILLASTQGNRAKGRDRIQSKVDCRG